MTNLEFINLSIALVRRIEATGDQADADELLAALCVLESESVEELAGKLAIWRRSVTALRAREPELSLQDRLIYSVFRDAVRLSGRADFAAADDVRTEFLAKLMKRRPAA